MARIIGRIVLIGKSETVRLRVWRAAEDLNCSAVAPSQIWCESRGNGEYDRMIASTLGSILLSTFVRNIAMRNRVCVAWLV
jgi:hypothetical protein